MLLCRNPDEMRMKLSVQFQGEEGIDAGGVSREWYQVNFAHSLPNMFLWDLAFLLQASLRILLLETLACVLSIAYIL